MADEKFICRLYFLMRLSRSKCKNKGSNIGDSKGDGGGGGGSVGCTSSYSIIIIIVCMLTPYEYLMHPCLTNCLLSKSMHSTTPHHATPKS